MTGGVVEFSDGTLWSYEGQSPAGGDQVTKNPPAWGNFPGGHVLSWVNIMERKPGSEVWERLTPDLWGYPLNAQPPNHPKWPSFHTNIFLMNPALTDFSGDLNVAHIGTPGNASWAHVQDGDDVWFYNRTWIQDVFGPVKVNRHTRRWERFVTNSYARDLWSRLSSNLLIHDGHFWFLAYPEFYCGIEYNNKGMSLCRAPLGNPDGVNVVKEWGDPDVWRNDLVTSNLEFPDYIDNQYMPRGNYSIVIHDGHLIYFTPQGQELHDSRSTPMFLNDPSARNHDMKYSMIRRAKLGTWELSTLVWHTSPQGWVGRGGNGYGTQADATVGVTNQPDLTATLQNMYPAVGMGLQCSGEHDAHISDGWLYWVDASAWRPGIPKGDHHMLCRVKLSDILSGVPVQHDPLSPMFEIVTNGSVPWEGDAGHWGTASPRIEYRAGSQPLLPALDTAFTFSQDGTILYKGTCFPGFYSYSDGDGLRGIWRLSPPTKPTRVTLSFVGDELKGYGNVRGVAVTRGEIEVELGT